MYKKNNLKYIKELGKIFADRKASEKKEKKKHTTKYTWKYYQKKKE